MSATVKEQGVKHKKAEKWYYNLKTNICVK